MPLIKTVLDKGAIIGRVSKFYEVCSMNRQHRWLRRLLGSVGLSRQSSFTVQRSDGLSWMGPDYRHGITFTNVELWIYRFENKQSAVAAVKASGIGEWLEANKEDLRLNDGTITIVKVPKD
jgi:hypothetical protein